MNSTVPSVLPTVHRCSSVNIKQLRQKQNYINNKIKENCEIDLNHVCKSVLGKKERTRRIKAKLEKITFSIPNFKNSHFNFKNNFKTISYYYCR